MLTPRQQVILSAIVEDYVQSAEPVGSRALSKHEQIRLSAATIRNEMSDLEELGYLDQPHTSAGRVPSQKGYRFYVDNLMDREEMDEKSVVALREVFQRRMDEVERTIHETSLVLSELTQYTSIVMGPRMFQEKIRQVELIPLAAGHAVTILVTDTGHVESRQVKLSEDVSSDDVAQMVKLLNARLVGVPLYRFRSHLYREIAQEMASSMGRFEDALAVLDELSRIGNTDGERVYVGGTTNILAQPEFRDVDKVRPLLTMLERGEVAGQMLTMNPVGIQVRIGLENNLESLQDCTVVSATYSIRGVPVGGIGILGPTRMNYARVVRILDYVSLELSKLMTDRVSG